MCEKLERSILRICNNVNTEEQVAIIMCGSDDVRNGNYFGEKP